MTMYSSQNCNDEKSMKKWQNHKMRKGERKGSGSVVSDSGSSTSSSSSSNCIKDTVSDSGYYSSTSSRYDSIYERKDNSPLTSPISHSEKSHEQKSVNNFQDHEEFSSTQTCEEQSYINESPCERLDDQNSNSTYIKTESNNSKYDILPSSLITSLIDTQASNQTASKKIIIRKPYLRETEHNKQKRFNRTAKALRDSGLLSIAIQTGNLLKRNLVLQKEIDKLKQETESFLQTNNSESDEVMDPDKTETASNNSVT